MSRPRVIVAAKVQAYINGVQIGRVTSFRWSSDTPRKAIMGLDSPTPVELAPTIARCTGSLGLLRTVLDGGIEALGMTAHSSQFVRERYFTLTLVEITSDTLLFRADFCSVTNQSWEVAARGIMTGSVNFEGIYWNNETSVSQS